MRIDHWVVARKDCPHRLHDRLRSIQNVRIIVTHDRHPGSQRWRLQREADWFPVRQASSAEGPI